MVKIDDTARGSVRCPHRVERTFEPSECGSPFGEISEVGGGDGYNFGGGSSSSGGYGGGDEFEFGFETGTREGPIPEFDPQAFENPVASPGDGCLMVRVAVVAVAAVATVAKSTPRQASSTARGIPLVACSGAATKRSTRRPGCSNQHCPV